jgi:hypothetical protein
MKYFRFFEYSEGRLTEEFFGQVQEVHSANTFLKCWGELRRIKDDEHSGGELCKSVLSSCFLGGQKYPLKSKKL